MIYLSISTGCKVSSDNKRVGDPDPKASNCTCWPMPSRRIATTLIEKAEGVNEAGCEKEQKQSWYATSKCHDCNISFQSICIYKLQVPNIFIHVVYIPHPFSSHIHSITFKVLSWIWSICCWTWTFTNCNHQFRVLPRLTRRCSGNPWANMNKVWSNGTSSKHGGVSIAR